MNDDGFRRQSSSDPGDKLTLLEQVKIQAEVLLPVMREMRRQIGAARHRCEKGARYCDLRYRIGKKDTGS